MICYKDRSWCVHSINTLCNNTSCSRFYTKEERQYNNNELPLSIADFKTDNCGYEATETINE